MVPISNEIILPTITQSAETVASNDDLLTGYCYVYPLGLSFTSNPYPNTGSLSLLILVSLSFATLTLPHHPVYFSKAPQHSTHQSMSTSPLIMITQTTLVPIPGHYVGEILQSCNGLLCCRSFEWCELDERYHIYNPTTKEFTTLPPPGGSKPPQNFCMILAFDPSSLPHYKVICVLDSGFDITHNRIEIYSSETRSWRASSQPSTATDTNFPGGIYGNGAIHWMRGSGSSLHFRIHEEKLETLPMPHLTDLGDEPRGPTYFGESHGHLHSVQTCGPRTTQLNVYEMERDYSKWYVKYHLDLDELPVAFPEMIQKSLDPTDRHYYTFSILSLVREERDEDSFMVLELPCKVIKYNILDKTFKKLSDVAQNLLGNDEVGLRYEGTSFQYIESLSRV